MVKSLKLILQPVNGKGVANGDASEITYPLPEHEEELEDLCLHVGNDVKAMFLDYMPNE